MDEDAGRPLLANCSQERSLLLISEVVFGITEFCEKINMTIVYLRPQAEYLQICLSSEKNISEAELLRNVALFRLNLDSLFCARGLIMANTSLEAQFEGRDYFKNILKKVLVNVSSN